MLIFNRTTGMSPSHTDEGTSEGTNEWFFILNPATKGVAKTFNSFFDVGFINISAFNAYRL